jgi:Na+/H+-dicarboxylate symporter
LSGTCGLVVVGFIALGPRYSHLLRLIREPLMIAFSTASSEAAYPKTLEGSTASERRHGSRASCCRLVIRSISTAP